MWDRKRQLIWLGVGLLFGTFSLYPLAVDDSGRTDWQYFLQLEALLVLVADGLDRGSKTTFGQVFDELLRQDITVYALQLPDRTGGALRRDRLKPSQVIQKWTEGTGGRVLSANEPREAAQAICDELRKNRYILAYTPSSPSLTDTRRLLIVPDEGITVRHKLLQPSN